MMEFEVVDATELIDPKRPIVLYQRLLVVRGIPKAGEDIVGTSGDMDMWITKEMAPIFANFHRHFRDVVRELTVSVKGR